MPRRSLSNQDDLRKRVLRIVRKKKMCDLDELILRCTSYSWTDVFLEVDELSRSGELRLLCKKAGEYSVTLPQAA
jgi:exosome complex RNA-binding protein Rrp42 (RNase PH superfamily)